MPGPQKSPLIPLFKEERVDPYYPTWEKGSPPFEKGRTGGISGKAFSKR